MKRPKLVTIRGPKSWLLKLFLRLYSKTGNDFGYKICKDTLNVVLKTVFRRTVDAHKLEPLCSSGRSNLRKVLISECDI